MDGEIAFIGFGAAVPLQDVAHRRVALAICMDVVERNRQGDGVVEQTACVETIVAFRNNEHIVGGVVEVFSELDESVVAGINMMVHVVEATVTLYCHVSFRCQCQLIDGAGNAYGYFRNDLTAFDFVAFHR